jgi:hypothetical protein
LFAAMAQEEQIEMGGISLYLDYGHSEGMEQYWYCNPGDEVRLSFSLLLGRRTERDQYYRGEKAVN